MAAEIETLRAKRERLKEELQTEIQKEKSLQEDVEILEEKIEIRGLEKELDTKRESVKQLELRKSELIPLVPQFTEYTRKDEKLKEALKEELQTEIQKEKSLQEDVEILEEKIEIRGLEKELDTKRESVKQLELRKSELIPFVPQSTQDTRKEEKLEEPSSEPTIIVMPDQASEPVESQESGARKKRKWF